VGLEWVCGLLQPGFVRLAPMLHKTTLTTDCSTIFFGRECTQQDNETAYNCSRVSGKACSVKPEICLSQTVTVYMVYQNVQRTGSRVGSVRSKCSEQLTAVSDLLVVSSFSVVSANCVCAVPRSVWI